MASSSEPLSTTAPPPFILPYPLPEGKTKDNEKIVQSLLGLDQMERSKAFSANFIRDERPVHTIGQMIGHPEIMQTYPQFEAEIFDAYLANTLFTVEVKTPYDTASKDFYDNFSDCGRIDLPPSPRMKNTDETTPYNTQVNRVRFDVCSSFSGVLCHVFVTLYQAHVNYQGECVDEKITATVSPVEYGHELLFSFLEKACQTIRAQKVEGHHMGLSFENMEAIATFFVPRRS